MLAWLRPGQSKHWALFPLGLCKKFSVVWRFLDLWILYLLLTWCLLISSQESLSLDLFSSYPWLTSAISVLLPTLFPGSTAAHSVPTLGDDLRPKTQGSCTPEFKTKINKRSSKGLRKKDDYGSRRKRWFTLRMVTLEEDVIKNRRQSYGILFF